MHLSDEEIEKIAEKVTTQLRHDLYMNVGQGVLGFMWKGVILLIVALAAYGAGVGLVK